MFETLIDRWLPYPWLDHEGEVTAGSRAEAEKLAVQAYERAVGRVFRVHDLTGYRDDNNTHDFYPEGGVLVRVCWLTERNLEQDVRKRWMDRDHLDPVYEVEVLEPEKLPEDARSLWLYAKSYHVSAPSTVAMEVA